MDNAQCQIGIWDLSTAGTWPGDHAIGVEDRLPGSPRGIRPQRHHHREAAHSAIKSQLYAQANVANVCRGDAPSGEPWPAGFLNGRHTGIEQAIKSTGRVRRREDHWQGHIQARGRPIPRREVPARLPGQRGGRHLGHALCDFLFIQLGQGIHEEVWLDAGKFHGTGGRVEGDQSSIDGGVCQGSFTGSVVTYAVMAGAFRIPEAVEREADQRRRDGSRARS